MLHLTEDLDLVDLPDSQAEAFLHGGLAHYRLTARVVAWMTQRVDAARRSGRVPASDLAELDTRLAALRTAYTGTSADLARALESRQTLPQIPSSPDVPPSPDTSTVDVSTVDVSRHFDAVAAAMAERAYHDDPFAAGPVALRESAVLWVDGYPPVAVDPAALDALAAWNAQSRAAGRHAESEAAAAAAVPVNQAAPARKQSQPPPPPTIPRRPLRHRSSRRSRVAGQTPSLTFQAGDSEAPD